MSAYFWRCNLSGPKPGDGDELAVLSDIHGSWVKAKYIYGRYHPVDEDGYVCMDKEISEVIYWASLPELFSFNRGDALLEKHAESILSEVTGWSQEDIDGLRGSSNPSVSMDQAVEAMCQAMELSSHVR